MAKYIINVKRFDPTDPRLGRHVRHDSRSLSFRVEPVEDVNTLQSIRHTRYIPTLDQGQLGSCTGNAAVGCLGTGAFWTLDEIKGVLSPTDAVVDEIYSVGVYSDATALDPFAGTYPPTDTGSDGLSVAKVLKQRGLISGYLHALSFEAVLTALAKQPVIVGTVWRSNMFNPEPDGRIRISGSDEGGHEYVLDELDMENRRVWMQNSWTDAWGVDGRGYFTFGDFEALLEDDGDCTVFVPISEPAPQPTPPTPPTPDEPSDFERIVESIKAELDKLVAWFRSHAN